MQGGNGGGRRGKKNNGKIGHERRVPSESDREISRIVGIDENELESFEQMAKGEESAESETVEATDDSKDESVPLQYDQDMDSDQGGFNNFSQEIESNDEQKSESRQSEKDLEEDVEEDVEKDEENIVEVENDENEENEENEKSEENEENEENEDTEDTVKAKQKEEKVEKTVPHAERHSKRLAHLHPTLRRSERLAGKRFVRQSGVFGSASESENMLITVNPSNTLDSNTNEQSFPHPVLISPNNATSQLSPIGSSQQQQQQQQQSPSPPDSPNPPIDHQSQHLPPPPPQPSNSFKQTLPTELPLKPTSTVFQEKPLQLLSQNDMDAEWKQLLLYFQNLIQQFKSRLADDYHKWLQSSFRPTAAKPSVPPLGQPITEESTSAIYQKASECINSVENELRGVVEGWKQFIFYTTDQKLRSYNGMSFTHEVQRAKQMIENIWLPKLDDCISNSINQMRKSIVVEAMPVPVSKPPSSATAAQLLAREIMDLGGEQGQNDPVFQLAKKELYEKSLHMDSTLFQQEMLQPADETNVNQFINATSSQWQTLIPQATQYVDEILEGLFLSWTVNQQTPIREMSEKLKNAWKQQILSIIKNDEICRPNVTPYLISKFVFNLYLEKFLSPHLIECMQTQLASQFSQENVQLWNQRLQILQQSLNTTLTEFSNSKDAAFNILKSNGSLQGNESLLFEQAKSVIAHNWIQTTLPLALSIPINDLANSLQTIGLDSLIKQTQHSDYQEQQNPEALDDQQERERLLHFVSSNQTEIH